MSQSRLAAPTQGERNHDAFETTRAAHATRVAKRINHAIDTTAYKLAAQL
jgi:hypothetical protein